VTSTVLHPKHTTSLTLQCFDFDTPVYSHPHISLTLHSEFVTSLALEWLYFHSFVYSHPTPYIQATNTTPLTHPTPYTFHSPYTLNSPQASLLNVFISTLLFSRIKHFSLTLHPALLSLVFSHFMYMYICIYIHVYMHIYSYVYICKYIYVHTYTYTHACTYTYV